MAKKELEFTWTRIKTVKAEEPVSRRYHTGYLYKTQMYVFGGTGGGKEARNDIYALDLETGKWSVVQVSPDSKIPERFAHVAGIYESKLYIQGGNGGMGFLAKDDFFYCDLAASQLVWTPIQVPGGPSARYHHSSVVSKDGKFYLFGGARTNKVYYNDLFVFDFVKQTWTELKPTIPSTLTPRAGNALFFLNGKLYIYGGFGGEGGYDSFTDMYSLDTENPTEWIQVALPKDKPTPLSGRPINTVTTSKYAYIFGGYDGKKPAGHLFRFSPTEGFVSISLWLEMDVAQLAAAGTSSKGLEPIPRYGHCICVDEEKKLITVYGGSGSMYLSDAIQIAYNDAL